MFFYNWLIILNYFGSISRHLISLVMIRVRLVGKKGNQMFQFAFAYLLAKKLKTPFILDPWYQNFDLKEFTLSFPYNLLEYKVSRILYTKIQRLLRFKRKIFNLDCRQTVINTKLENRCEYIGYFQDAALYSNELTTMRKIFTVKKKYLRNFQKKYQSILDSHKILVISVRLGDYKGLKVPELGDAPALLPFEWYISQLSTVNLSEYKVFVMSDDILEAEVELRKRMNRDVMDKNFTFFNDTVTDGFLLLQHADLAIITNSTFAWWAAFLNCKKGARIIAPEYFLGYNARKEFPIGIQYSGFEWR